jgi:FdrA protein
VVVHVEVRRGAYADSVALLQVSRDVAAVDGVESAQVAMATPLNVEVLAGMGFEVPACSPNDMVVAIRLGGEGDRAGLDAALAAVDAALRGGPRSTGATVEEPPRTTASAFRRAGGALALVSTPGASAVVEAVDALEAGHDVMVFSDNVPLAHEVALKRLASERGLLVMGPDCGTALVGGVGLGFADVVMSGSGPTVGIVAASGTGCQQLMCLLSYAGVTVGAALGVGGRDLSAEVGGLSTREALHRLDADGSIDRVLLVSKPPDDAVAVALHEATGAMATPVDLALLGPGQPDLTTVAETVLRALGVDSPTWPRWTESSAERRAPARTEGHLRGLFVGGTLCTEAAIIVRDRLGADAGHTFVDFGDDDYTRGRAHPMIDPTLRLEEVARAAADPETAVLLLDVVLGHGAEPDPAALLAPAVEAATRDHGVPVVVACVGTEADPQGLSRQAEALAAAGADVFLSNRDATMTALDMLERA